MRVLYILTHFDRIYVAGSGSYIPALGGAPLLMPRESPFILFVVSKIREAAIEGLDSESRPQAMMGLSRYVM